MTHAESADKTKRERDAEKEQEAEECRATRRRVGEEHQQLRANLKVRQRKGMNGSKKTT